MAAVVFAFGARPGVPEGDARELADLLSATRTLAGNSAAEKIRVQARKDPDRGETSEDIELDEHELEALAAVLANEPWPQEQQWFEHMRDEPTTTRGGGALTTYRIVLGTAPDAPIVQREARAGSLHIGDEVFLEGAMRSIYQLAEPGRDADFIAVLAAPAAVLTLADAHVEIYRGELAQIRPEVARLVDARGEAASEALNTIKAILEDDERSAQLSDEAIGVISEALWAMDVSHDLSDRLRAVWHEIRDYLNARQPG